MFNGCILWGGVGSGKTRVACSYYMEVEADADVFVITTARKRDSLDWEGEFAKFGVGKHLNATLGGKLTVDSWNNISKYTSTRGGFFIFDEQRLVGSGEWTRAFIEIAKHNRWILLTATPGDTWLDYIPVFLAHGYYKNRTQFKLEHVVYSYHSKFPKVERYQGVGKLVRLRNKLLVPMPYARHTTRNVEIVEVDYDKERFERVLKKRWHVFEERPLKDVGELFLVMRKVVNTSASRGQAVREALLNHPRLIVFYNFDYELEMLRELGESLKNSSEETSHSSSLKNLEKGSWQKEEMSLSGETGSSTKTDVNGNAAKTSRPEKLAGFEVAEWNGHKHEEVPKSEKWLYLVQYVAGAEAWNCTETDTMLFYSLTYSYKNFEQAMGRTDRLNTPYTFLNYKILKSSAVIDNAIWKSLSNKENFNESSLLKGAI